MLVLSYKLNDVELSRAECGWYADDERGCVGGGGRCDCNLTWWMDRG